MDLRRIFDDEHVFALHPAVSQLVDGCPGIREQSLFVGGIHPGASDNTGTVARADLVFIGIDQNVERRGIDEPLLNQ